MAFVAHAHPRKVLIRFDRMNDVGVVTRFQKARERDPDDIFYFVISRRLHELIDRVYIPAYNDALLMAPVPPLLVIQLTHVPAKGEVDTDLFLCLTYSGLSRVSIRRLYHTAGKCHLFVRTTDPVDIGPFL